MLRKTPRKRVQANGNPAKPTTPPTTSFTTKKINSTTFAICEDDAFYEYPLIYVKLHPRSPLVVISDTGCNNPSKAHSEDQITHLRDYIENYPLESNNNESLNPQGFKHYLILCSHCHFDHIGGISQFEGGTTEIVASSAGRDFVESDLNSHGLFKWFDLEPPSYQVSYWASSFEGLKWPIWHKHEGEPQPAQNRLGIETIHTPGHTPDSMAWYDREEMALFVGDSFYEEGEEGMPIVFPGEGNLIEWVFSMQKLLVFVRSENARAAQASEYTTEDNYVKVAKRVQVNCGHQTSGVDAEEILARLEMFSARVYRGDVPVAKKDNYHDDEYFTWKEEDGASKMSIRAPARLMEDARRFFNLYLEDNVEGEGRPLVALKMS